MAARQASRRGCRSPRARGFELLERQRRPEPPEWPTQRRRRRLPAGRESAPRSGGSTHQRTRRGSRSRPCCLRLSLRPIPAVSRPVGSGCGPHRAIGRSRYSRRCQAPATRWPQTRIPGCGAASAARSAGPATTSPPRGSGASGRRPPGCASRFPICATRHSGLAPRLNRTPSASRFRAPDAPRALA